VFLADDIVLFPVKSLLSLFREIYNAAVQEMAEEADSIRAELGQLYQSLEAGTLDEAAFDAREQQLLDRLDAIDARDEDDDEDEPEDDEDEEEDEADEDEDEEEEDEDD
jgi:Gas vesicle protein G